MTDNELPQIISRQTERLSSWVSVEAVTVRGADPNAAVETYHGIRQVDYVNVLAMTRNGAFRCNTPIPANY